MQIAIAYANQPDRVAIWAHQNRTNKAGTVFFEVINGRWFGHIRKDGRLFTAADDGYQERDSVPAKIVWRGHAPFSDLDYNTAIAWIESQIAITPKADDYWGA
jgi:hypothetical protein